MLVDLIRAPDPTCIDDQLDEPLGLLYLAAVLREAGHEARITNLAGHTAESWKDCIRDGADAYGVQLYTPTAAHGVRIARFLKERFPGTPVLGGGAHPSAVPEHPDLAVFDSLAVGEGERTILELVGALAAGRKPPRLLRADPIEDLDALPLPARDLVDMMSFHRKVNGRRAFGVLGSRGCSYKCAFCDHALFGSRVRWRSVANVVGELEHIIERHNVRSFEFFDDLFTLHRKRLVEFEARTGGYNLSYRCNGRTDVLDPDIYRLLKRTGCDLICYGIESGSQMILDRMRKQTTVETNLKAIRVAQEAGLTVAGYFLLGFPGETRDTIRETIEFINRSGIDQAQFYTFIPLPGCDVWEHPEAYGARIVSRDFSDYFLVTGTDGRGGRAVATDTLSPDDLAGEMVKIRAFLKERGARGKVQDYYVNKLKYNAAGVSA